MYKIIHCLGACKCLKVVQERRVLNYHISMGAFAIGGVPLYYFLEWGSWTILKVER